MRFLAMLGRFRRSAPASRVVIALVVAAVSAVVAALLVPGPSTAAAAAASASDWPQYLNGPAHSSFNAAAASITVAGVQAGDLQPVWRWAAPVSPNSGKNTFFASPTVVGGVVYIGAEDGMFYAVSEATQTILWSRFLGLDLPTGSCGSGAQGIVSTAAVVPDPATGKLTVYVFGPTGVLYALDAATGTTVWTAQVDTPSATQNDYYSWGSPLVVNGHVYIGISSDCDNPLIPGGLAEYNQSTGARVASWTDVPSGQIGGSIWSSPAALADGSIIAATGNGFSVGGNPRYDDSIVRLGGSNLTVSGSWQLPPDQQLGDSDFGGSPTLFSADLQGTVTPMVGACDKNGVYYALRQHGVVRRPVWQTLLTVPQPGNYEQCDAAAIWDGTNLIAAGGAPTKINGHEYLGSVQSLDPATGKPRWQTGIPGFVIGSPTEDGAGVVAAALYQADTTADMGVYLLDAGSGQIIGRIPQPSTYMFAQPVFAGRDLLVAGNQYLTAYEITTPGPPITDVTPGSVAAGTSGNTVTLTGSGFTGTPHVFVSGTLVNVTGVKRLSATSLSVTVTADAAALTGPRNITVVEPGTAPHVASTCRGCLTVTAPDTTTLASSANPSTYGQPVTFTATVANGTSTVPTGTVAFKLGSATLGTGTLDSTGTATFTTSALAAGPQLVNAVYSGDANNPASTSNNVDEAINPALTTTKLTASPNPATYGQPVKLTGTVTLKGAGGFTPDGVVVFYHGTTFLGSGKLNNSGIATFTTAALPAGTDHLSAYYPGAGNATGSPSGPLQGQPSTSNHITETINPAATSTTLTSTPNPSTLGQSVQFTATVTNGSANTPTGTVTFLDGTTVLGTSTPDGTGTATLTTPALPAGTHQITASYSGDTNNNGSVSNALAQVVNP